MREQFQQLEESHSRKAVATLKQLTDDWESRNATLVTQVDTLERSKASADKDREFFREQYAKASGFVSSVRDENKDLEKRLKIAEDQAKAGVGLVRATFELRVKTLEDDVKSWRRMAEFLIEKDKRTDNDEIRRRAAEEPELRSRCRRQEESLELMQERMEELEAELEQKERQNSAANAELGQWRRETTRLTADLNEAFIKLDRIGRAGDEASQGNGHEYVYRCMWRMDDGGSESMPCPETFLTMTVSTSPILEFII